MAKPAIIALVGIDGSGKTTHARWLAGWLTSQGLAATAFGNPGGRVALDRFARRLGFASAAAVLGRRGFVALEAAIRWLLIARALLRARLTGRIAVMDRYAYCQYATIRARGDRWERLARAMYAVFPRPDLVCFLAVSPAEAQRRIRARAFDSEELSYLAAADAGYRSLPEFTGFTALDADPAPERVQAALAALVTTVLGRSA